MLLAGTSTLWEACSPWARKALFLGLCTKCTLTRQDAYRNPNQHSIKQFRSVQKCWQLKLSFDLSSLLQVPPTTHPGWIANTCLQKQDCISHFTKTICAGWQVQLGHSVVLQTCTHHQEILYANNFQILKSVAQLQCVLVSTRDCILPRNGSKEPCSCQVDSYHRCWDPLYTSSSPSASASILRLPSLQRRLKIYGQRGEWAIGRTGFVIFIPDIPVVCCWNLLDPAINLGSGCLIGLIGLSNCRLPGFDAKSTQTKGQHPSSKKGGHTWPNTASCTRPNNQRRRS